MPPPYSLDNAAGLARKICLAAPAKESWKKERGERDSAPSASVCIESAVIDGGVQWRAVACGGVRWSVILMSVNNPDLYNQNR